MKLEVKVDEADVGQVQEGQRAVFTVDAFPDREFPAAIQRVDVGATPPPAARRRSRPPQAALRSSPIRPCFRSTTPDLLLRPGMTATAEIVTQTDKNVLLVPNAALRFKPKVAGDGDRKSALTMMPPTRLRPRARRPPRSTAARSRRSTRSVPQASRSRWW